KLVEGGHEQLIFCQHRPTKLRALIAIHNTTLGPALGGCRIRDYRTEDDAVADTLRLAESMTYQTAIANYDAGGGMTVIWGEPEIKEDEAVLRAFGRFLNGLGGRIVAFSDLGTDDDDMRSVGIETPHVIASSPHEVPSDVGAAWGVYYGITACLNTVFNSANVRDRTVVIQGVGGVGNALASILVQMGAKLVISDLRYDPLKAIQDLHPEVEMVRTEEVYDVPCDVFSPCAVGGVLDSDTVERLRCKIVAGAAFNILSDTSLALRLEERGILFAPDFVINAGDILMMNRPRGMADTEKVKKATRQIYVNLSKVLTRARHKGIPPLFAAQEMAREKIARIGKTKSIKC
ncbi:Glu/Leu/Phe/Val dehydrogenase, partial [bacterium]|nr:Glu/Leu/Phe/Val dehydrogenase [bacterium]